MINDLMVDLSTIVAYKFDMFGSVRYVKDNTFYLHTFTGLKLFQTFASQKEALEMFDDFKSCNNPYSKRKELDD